MSGVLPDLAPHHAEALRTALLRAGYTTDGVRTLLGPATHAALGRGEVEPAFRASRDGGELGVLVRMLLLGSTEPDTAVTAALAPLSPADAASSGLLAPAGDGWGPHSTCARTATPTTAGAATGGCCPTSTPDVRNATTSQAWARRR